MRLNRVFSPMNDKRAEQRQRVFKSAKIAMNRGGVIDCTIRDISKNGACLRVASPLGIPDVLELVLDDKIQQRCRVKWRKETQIGVQFQSTIVVTTDAPQPSLAVRKNTSLSVLVVDDSSTMTLMISDLVRKAGFTDVDAANDGHAALEKLRHKKYGLDPLSVSIRHARSTAPNL